MFQKRFTSVTKPLRRRTRIRVCLLFYFFFYIYICRCSCNGYECCKTLHKRCKTDAQVHAQRAIADRMSVGLKAIAGRNEPFAPTNCRYGIFVFSHGQVRGPNPSGEGEKQNPTKIGISPSPYGFLLALLIPSPSPPLPIFHSLTPCRVFATTVSASFDALNCSPYYLRDFRA